MESELYFPTLISSCALIFDGMHNLQKLNPKLNLSSKAYPFILESEKINKHKLNLVK